MKNIDTSDIVYIEGDKTADKYIHSLRRAEYEPLSKKQERKLFKEYRAGMQSAREKIFKANLRFVVSVAKRHRYPGGPGLIDLIDLGNEGLWKSIPKYKPGKGAKLLSYAVKRIQGNIIDGLRRHRQLITDSQLVRYKTRIKHAYDMLAQEISHEPTPTMIYDYLEIEELHLETIYRVLNHTDKIRSLDAPRFEGTESTSLLDVLASPSTYTPTDEEAPVQHVLTSVSQALTVLRKEKPKWANALEMRYGLGVPQTYDYDEIAMEVGIKIDRNTKSKISNIIKNAELNLKRILKRKE